MQPGQNQNTEQLPEPQLPDQPDQQDFQQLPPAPDQPQPEQSATLQQQQQQAQVQEQKPAEEHGWKFNIQEAFAGTKEQEAPPAPNVNPVSWTASEYIQHNKSPFWYVAAGSAIFIVALIVYYITDDIISAAVIGIAGMALAVFSARPPQVLQYTIDSSGIHIGSKTYLYKNFKSFSVQEEESLRSILLMPSQRIGLPITIYYDPKDEAKIVQALGTILPHEERQVAAIDKFMRKIRF